MYRIVIDPVRNKTVSKQRKQWCHDNVGTPGEDWWVRWIIRDDDTMQDQFSFINEQDAIMFALRWS